MTTAPQLRARLVETTERRVVVDVEGPQGRGTLEYWSPDPVWEAPPPNLDFAAVALVQQAASQGCDLVLEGAATRQQLDRLDEFQTIWSVWRPDLFRRIRVLADDEVEPVAGERAGAAMGFSGGVDAGFAFAAHRSGILGRLTRQVDLAMLGVGWDLKPGDEAALDAARTSAERALTPYGVPLAVVHTNWRQQYCPAWFMCFNAGITSILHTFSATHSAAVHATDHSYRLELRMPPYGSNLGINHLLGNPGFPVISTGGTHRRIERVAFLGDHPALLKELRVCYKPGNGGRNCGHCEKCVRTQLELRATGLPADAFPSPMVADDVRRATINNPTVLMHFEDILDRLSPDDELYDVVREWVESQRLARAPRVRELTERVEELEEQLRSAREELDGLRGSRSWRITRPVRATAALLRGRRD